MKNLIPVALMIFAVLGSVAAAQTTMTRAQMHTTNNLNRYSNGILKNLRRYSR